VEIDFTRDLISWVIQEGYSLIDVNLTERLASQKKVQAVHDAV
jgi:hypothetical protein